jgi:hypothetical protein
VLLHIRDRGMASACQLVMAAFAVICETIRSMNMVAIGTVVLTSREHIIAFEPLRHPYDSAFGENEGNSET